MASCFAPIRGLCFGQLRSLLVQVLIRHGALQGLVFVQGIVESSRCFTHSTGSRMTHDMLGYIWLLQELDFFICQLLASHSDGFINPCHFAKSYYGAADAFTGQPSKRYVAHSPILFTGQLLYSTYNLNITFRQRRLTRGARGFAHLTGISPTPVSTQYLFISLSSSL